MKQTTLLFAFLCILCLPIEAHSRDIKIGLLITNSPITITSNQDAVLLNAQTNKTITKTKKNEKYTLQNINGLIRITPNKSGTTIGAFSGTIKLIPKRNNGHVAFNNHWYRGHLTILTNKSQKNLTVINNVELEDYLLSVVSSEIPSSWNIEALKAQAVAARSYSLGYLGRRMKKGYDLESTVEDQMYLGIKSENKSTTKAVKETKGVILIDNDNKPLIALYHSSGGGYTDSIENLWDKEPSPHIKPRPDYDDKSPHFKWFRKYEIAEVNKQLKNLAVGDIKKIIPLSRSISNRVTYIKIIGTQGEKTIRGEKFRRQLNLPSSKFNFNTEENQVKFSGRGFGHGLGMSQWGAKALADNGFTYRQILAHYYVGARLVKIME